MRVLIVGCGYVGRALGIEMAQAGHTVYGVRRSLLAADLEAAGIRALRADISRREQLDPLPAPFDWVVNCAASGHGGVEAYRQVYLAGTRNLLAWLRASPPQKYVYTSSTGVYGQVDGSAVTETSVTEPGTPTGEVLLETERMLRAAALESGFPGVILRVAGIYGPGRGYWFKQMLSGEARIEGAGQRILNLIHQDDVVGCIQAALRSGKAGEVYNATDDEPVAQREFLEWLARKLGQPLPASVPEDALAARKRGLTSKRVLNHKLKLELGYRFKYPTFREGYPGCFTP